MNAASTPAPFGWMQWSSTELEAWSAEMVRQLHAARDPVSRELLEIQIELMNELLARRREQVDRAPGPATILPFSRRR